MSPSCMIDDLFSRDKLSLQKKELDFSPCFTWEREKSVQRKEHFVILCKIVNFSAKFFAENFAKKIKQQFPNYEEILFPTDKGQAREARFDLSDRQFFLARFVD